VEELADILEVIEALLDWHDISREELKELRREKRKERGGFARGLYLLRVEE